METTLFDQLSQLLEDKYVDEFDILDQMIFEYYWEGGQEDQVEYASEHLILIEGKLGLSQSGVQELFKKCKPIAKSFRAVFKPFNLPPTPIFSLSD